MSNKTQSNRVFEALRADILGCRLLPGGKLRINDIAEEAQVSLGAVREALSRLGAEGLVIPESQKGYHVAPLSAAEFRDLTEARVEIECIALTRSLGAGDLDWETNLVAAWHRLSRTLPHGDNPKLYSDSWAAAHAGYHEALVAACGSNKILQIRQQLYEQAERYRRFSGIVARGERDVLGEHRRIFEAAVARDAPEASRALAEHLRHTAEIIVNSPALTAEDEPAPRRARAG